MLDTIRGFEDSDRWCRRSQCTRASDMGDSTTNDFSMTGQGLKDGNQVFGVFYDLEHACAGMQGIQD